MGLNMAKHLDSGYTEETHSHSETDNESNVKRDSPKKSKIKTKNVREQFSCSHCSLVFSRRDAFDRHEFIHTGIKKFHCPKSGCTKHYTNQSHLRRHIRTAHTERIAKPKGKLKCSDETCEQMFSHQSAMARHYKNVHLGMKPKFICHYCNEQFERKVEIKTHMIEHSNKYPYKCKTCKAGFLTQKLAEQHSILKSHRPLHTCTQCQKTFVNKSNLKVHMARHQAPGKEIAVYKCPVYNCANYFAHTNALRVHTRRIHMMQKYECYYCSRQLSTKQKLKFHMLKLHMDGIVKKYIPPKKKLINPRKFIKKTLSTFDPWIFNSSVALNFHNYAKKEMPPEIADPIAIKTEMKMEPWEVWNKFE